MKKTFLAITALAAMLFAGCTSSDELTTLESIKTADNTPTPVQFGTYMGKTGTRAGIGGEAGHQTTATIQAASKGFGVFAFYNTDGAPITFDASAAFGAAINESIIPNFMYNQHVTYGATGAATKWVYYPVKYWPNDFVSGNVDKNQGDGEDANAQGSGAHGNLSFFAYAPYVDVTQDATPSNPANVSTSPEYGIMSLTGNATTKDPIVTYKLKGLTDAESAMSNDNVDLLWGLSGAASYTQADGGTQASTKGTNYNVNLKKEYITDNVNFLFKHALSSVGGRMNATSGNAGVKIVLDVDGASGDSQETYFGTGFTYNTGTGNAKTSLVTVEEINIEDVLQTSKSTLNTDGKFDIANGTWNNQAQNGATDKHYVNITYDSDDLNAQIVEPADNKLSYSSGWKNDGTDITGVTTSVQDALNATLQPSIYLIPGSTDQKFKVTIKYKVRTYDANLAANTADADKPTTDADAHWTMVNQQISNIVTLPSTFLAPNKHVTLIIHIGLTSVKFEAAVTDWNDADGDGTADATVEEKVWLPSNAS